MLDTARGGGTMLDTAGGGGRTFNTAEGRGMKLDTAGGGGTALPEEEGGRLTVRGSLGKIEVNRAQAFSGTVLLASGPDIVTCKASG